MTVSYTVLPSSITTFSENSRILGDVVLFTHCKIALLQFDWSRAPVSHLHMQNKQESEMGNEMIERKDGAGKNARRKRETGRAALKVVGWLRSRCTKWVAAGSERASDGRRKKKREREKQSWCSSWAEQMHLVLLNIGHTSPVTVPSTELASCSMHFTRNPA